MAGGTKGAASVGDLAKQQLHDLCQPVTALQFHLEIAQMGGEGQWQPVVLEECLRECRRLVTAVGLLRDTISRLDGRGNY